MGSRDPPPLVCDSSNASLVDLDWAEQLPSADLPGPCRVRGRHASVSPHGPALGRALGRQAQCTTSGPWAACPLNCPPFLTILCGRMSARWVAHARPALWCSSLCKASPQGWHAFTWSGAHADCQVWSTHALRPMQELYAILAQPRIDLDVPRAHEGSLVDAIAFSLRTPGALLHSTIQVGQVGGAFCCWPYTWAAARAGRRDRSRPPTQRQHGRLVRPTALLQRSNKGTCASTGSVCSCGSRFCGKLPPGQCSLPGGQGCTARPSSCRLP